MHQGVWLVFIMVFFCLIMLACGLRTGLGVVIFAGFYLFVGGVLCVSGFFLSFFWGSWSLSKFYNLNLALIFFSFCISVRSKFSGSGILELLSSWNVINQELVLSCFVVSSAFFLLWISFFSQLGCVRGFEILTISFKKPPSFKR